MNDSMGKHMGLPLLESSANKPKNPRHPKIRIIRDADKRQKHR